MKNYKHRDDCRLCGSKSFELVLPILHSPIGDAFVDKGKLSDVQELFPLDTYICLECGHVQNIDIVNPDILFRNYTYKTSASHGLVDHFKRYAQQVLDRLSIPSNSLVIEMGSNDGSLLGAFKSIGMRVLGVDPAVEIANNATRHGINTLPEFFSFELAKKIANSGEIAHLFCANNVFAHVDNISDIVKGIRLLLDPRGVFVFEVSYLPDMVNGFVFDTIYHEHVSHHSLIPLELFFNKHDMTLFHAERISTKGGSIRAFAQSLSTGKRQKTKMYLDMMSQEREMMVTSPELYHKFNREIDIRKRAVLELIDDEIKAGKKIAAYGASTTTTTLLYHFELQSRIQFIVDDNPLKHNLYSPGAHIPVYSSSALKNNKPDIVIILAWQYANEIIKNNQEFLSLGGKFLIPLPELKIH